MIAHMCACIYANDDILLVLFRFFFKWKRRRYLRRFQTLKDGSLVELSVLTIWILHAGIQSGEPGGQIITSIAHARYNWSHAVNCVDTQVDQRRELYIFRGEVAIDRLTKESSFLPTCETTAAFVDESVRDFRTWLAWEETHAFRLKKKSSETCRRRPARRRRIRELASITRLFSQHRYKYFTW